MTTPLFVFLTFLLELFATPMAHARRASSANNATSIFTSNATILALKSNWSRLATVEVPARDRAVANAIDAVTGVYRNRSWAVAAGLQRTVLVSVVSLSDSRTAGAYVSILKNYLCYTAHYGHQPLVYYVQERGGGGADDVTSTLADLRRHNPFARFVAYPDQLFWQVPFVLIACLVMLCG